MLQQKNQKTERSNLYGRDRLPSNDKANERAGTFRRQAHEIAEHYPHNAGFA